MEAIVAKNEEVGKVVEIVPYASLDPETRQLVDNDVIKLSQMQDTELVRYGWDVQEKKNQILNDFVSGFESLSVRDIDVILDDIMKSRKSVTPKKESFFLKEYVPTMADKKKFVGKVGKLEDAIKAQIARLLENNNTYARLILECKNIVDSYAVSVMAIDKYLTEVDDMVVREVLKNKKESLVDSRIVNLQSAAMYMNLYRNNILLMNRLYGIINVKLHQMQEQILIQTGIEEIKKVLSHCEGIRDSIDSLTVANIEDLKATSAMVQDERFIAEEKRDYTEKLTEEMDASLKVIANRKVEVLQKTYTPSFALTPVKQNNIEGFVLIEASQLSLDDEFMRHTPVNADEREFKKILSKVIRRGVKDFYAPIRNPSLNISGEGICYTGGSPVYGRSCKWYSIVAKSFKPEYNSRLGTYNEYIAFLGVFIKTIVSNGCPLWKAWHAVCKDFKILLSESARVSGYHTKRTGTGAYGGFADMNCLYKIVQTKSDFCIVGTDFADGDLFYTKYMYQFRLDRSTCWVIIPTA